MPQFALSTLPLLMYINISVWATKESGVLITLHSRFANRALLKHLISLKLSPPYSLESPSFFHFLQYILLSFRFLLNQNWAMIRAISLHNLLERVKTPIVYVGMAWTTAFRSISLPTWDKKEFYQLWIRFHNLSFSSPNVLYFDWPIVEGKPKYLASLPQDDTPAFANIISLVSLLVLALKNIDVFCLLRH